MNKFLLFPLSIITLLCCSFSSYKTQKNIQVQQKWIVSSRSIASRDKQGTHTATTPGLKNDYMLFGKDGKAYCCFNGNCDTLDYAIINDNVISFGDELYKIETLSSSEMVLYQNEEDSNGEYNRIWIRLKK